MCVCVRLPVYSWCIVSLGESIRRRERESRRQTSADGKRERDTSRVFSCITSSPQTAPLLLPDITSLISRSARRNILRRGSRFSKRLPFHPSGNSFNCLERSRALLSPSLSLRSLWYLFHLFHPKAFRISPPPPFLFLFSLSHPNPLSLSERCGFTYPCIVGIHTRARLFRIAFAFFFFSVSLGTFIKGTRVKGK